jgi:SET domain-containing protein
MLEDREPIVESLCVRPAEGKGRGVFAERAFARGELIERTPVIVLPGNQWELLEQTALRDYYFDWGSEAAVPVGFAMIYNHSEHPNVRVFRHVSEGVVEIVALRDITLGEELTHHYHCRPWFRIGA